MFGSTKASCPDCIVVLVLRNCETVLSFILADVFNMYLKKSCFSDCWKVSPVVHALKNTDERSKPKNCGLFFFCG